MGVRVTVVPDVNTVAELEAGHHVVAHPLLHPQVRPHDQAVLEDVVVVSSFRPGAGYLGHVEQLGARRRVARHVDTDPPALTASGLQHAQVPHERAVYDHRLAQPVLPLVLHRLRQRIAEQHVESRLIAVIVDVEPVLIAAAGAGLVVIQMLLYPQVGTRGLCLKHIASPVIAGVVVGHVAADLHAVGQVAAHGHALVDAHGDLHLHPLPRRDIAQGEAHEAFALRLWLDRRLQIVMTRVRVPVEADGPHEGHAHVQVLGEHHVGGDAVAAAVHIHPVGVLLTGHRATALVVLVHMQVDVRIIGPDVVIVLVVARLHIVAGGADLHMVEDRLITGGIVVQTQQHLDIAALMPADPRPRPAHLARRAAVHGPFLARPMPLGDEGRLARQHIADLHIQRPGRTVVAVVDAVEVLLPGDRIAGIGPLVHPQVHLVLYHLPALARAVVPGILLPAAGADLGAVVHVVA